MIIVKLLRPTRLWAAVAMLIALPLLACEAAGTGDDGSDHADLALIQEVMHRVQDSYVSPVNVNEFTTNALKGALTGLDPHSDYMDEREYHALLSDTQGEFGGLGMELTLQNGVPEIVSPIDDTPAARANLKSGDLIVKIGDQPTDRMSLSEAVERLRGPVATPVTLTILRGTRPPFPVTLTRAIIHVVSVKSSLQPGAIGYARVSVFNERTQEELTEALARLKRQAHGHLNGFVLDLRNDPGGLLDAAVEVAGDFVDGGPVVTTRGRESQDDQVYAAPNGSDRLAKTPMVVLINGASASASEIVAGALQDDHRATVMGTRSFGKGSVQTIIPLDGKGALRLTTARYYTPAGRSIQDDGITPDIVVVVPADEQVAGGTILHEADLRGALKNTGSLGGKSGGPTAAADRPADDSIIAQALIGTPKDAQLQAALKYLDRTLAKGGVGTTRAAANAAAR